jgi:hypothetical protein
MQSEDTTDDKQRLAAPWLGRRNKRDRALHEDFTPYTNRGVKYSLDNEPINEDDKAIVKVGEVVEPLHPLPVPASPRPVGRVEAPELIDAAVDWLTLSATCAEGEEELRQIALFVGAELVKLGEQVKDGQRELRFYVGECYGRHLFIGKSLNQGTILRASATIAVLVLQYCCFIPDRQFHATRVDIQTTIQFPDAPGRSFFRGVAEAAHEAAQNKPTRGRPWHVSLRDEFGRGDTVYLAARSSESYGRMYDKGREAPEQYAPGAVRCEVEHKGSQAEKMLDELCDRRDECGPWIAGYVAAWFQTHGVELPVDVAVVELLRTVEHYTDADRQLKWVADGVAPTLGRLVAAGYVERLIDAMGPAVVDAIVAARSGKEAS